MKDNNVANNQQVDALEEKLVQVNRVAKLLKVEEFLALQLLQLLVMETEELVLEEVRLKRYQLQFKKLWKMLEEAWLKLN